MLTSPRELKLLFKKHQFRPSRQRGQNFLADQNILRFIIRAAQFSQADAVLEIGAGAGTLTQGLAAAGAKHVFTIEIDPTLTKILAETIGPLKNVKIFKGDVLSRECFLEIEKWKAKNKIEKFKVVANLPYQITSNFLRQFLPRQDWQSMILMVQKEVAQRIMAKQGETSLLSLSVQFYSKPEIVRIVSKNSFWPAPEIDSAILKLDPAVGFKESAKVGEDLEKKMFQIMRMGFAARRKQLHNNLAAGLNMESVKIKQIFHDLKLDEKVRAQELGLKEWYDLTSFLYIQ